MLAHVWNELEHDLAYKPLSGELSEEERDLLVNLGHHVRSGDGFIEALLDARDRRLKQNEGEFIDQWDFVARMRERFAEVPDFGTHSGQLYDELLSCGYRSPQDIEEGLLQDGSGADELEELRAHLAERGDEVVRLDARTSDVLLMPFLDRHVDEVLERHPGGRGRGRPPRIASAARRFKDWRAAA
jgi:hypothetical protein